MALSNIRNEPRREITESLVGITAAAVFLFLDYELSSWVVSLSPSHQPPVFFVMIFLPLALFIGGFFLVGGFLVVTHSIGETACEWLAKHNLDPRPKERGR